MFSWPCPVLQFCVAHQDPALWRRQNYIPRHIIIWIIIFQEKDTIMALKKSESATYFCRVHLHVCAHASVFCHLRSNREVRECRRSSVAYKKENAYLVVGCFECYCCTTLSFTRSDTQSVRSHAWSTFEWQIHTCLHFTYYAQSVQSETPREGEDDTDIWNMLAIT